MGRSVNKVSLIGTLGRDPEVKQMPNGNSVATISIATDESYNDKQTGQKVEQTEWHRLVVYGKLAEICGQYLKKGSRAYFEGKLKTREWEKDGVKRYTTEVICLDMMLLDRAERSDQQQPSAQPASAYGQPQASAYAQPPQQQGYGQAPQQGYQPPPAPQGYQQAPQRQAAPQQAPQYQNHQQGPSSQYEDDIPF